VKWPVRPSEADNGLAIPMYDLMKAVCEATFKVVTWSILIATITYFSKKSGDTVLAVTATGLQILLIIYIYTAINRVELNLVPRERRDKRWKVVIDASINALVTVGLVSLTNRLMGHFVNTVAELQLGK